MASTGKSVWAVVAGVLFIIVVTSIVDILMHLIHFYPGWTTPINDGQAAGATAYRIVISVAGAYLTCWLAPQRPMKHAIILGLIGILLGSLGVVGNMVKSMGPMWYPVALVVLALPQCWLGAWLYEKKHPSDSILL
jgi:hypothetical protein